MLVRQAHPGGEEPEYTSYRQKVADARSYRREERLPWPVLVDDLEGRVHQLYGGLSDPCFLVDRDGRIAFFCTWTAPKALHRAIGELLGQGGRGVVAGGVRRPPELGPMLTDGWRGLRRGAPRSVTDLLVTMPPAPALLWLGWHARPLIRGITLRERPMLPRAAAAALGVVGLVAIGLLAWPEGRRLLTARAR